MPPETVGDAIAEAIYRLSTDWGMPILLTGPDRATLTAAVETFYAEQDNDALMGRG